MENVIEVHEIKKSYSGVAVVDGISFDVKKGEIFAILGPNGAGKTTTVESVIGLRRPDGGSVRVLGLDPQLEGARVRQRIGVQLQEAALPERMKVWEALDLFASFYKRAADWEPLIEEWGLTEKRNTAFGNLSGGQQQRLFIALALVNKPELVMLDELTTGLDPQARRATWELIRAIRDQGTSVVLVTHFMDEAEELADRVGIIDHGKMIALDTPQALISGLEAGQQVLFSVQNGFDPSTLEAVAGVTQIEQTSNNVIVRGEGALMAHVAAVLAEQNIMPADLRSEQASLEDVFLALTGSRIRN